MATRRLSCRLSLLACSTLHHQPTRARTPALALALADAVRCYATQAPQQTVILPDDPTASTPSSTADLTTPAPAPAPAPASPPASSSSTSRLPPLAPEPVPKIAPSPLLTRVQRPIGAFRGGLIGFLLGMTTVGIWGYTHLLQDYMTASKALLDSVQELHLSTEKMTSHIERIEAVEKTVNELSKSSSTNDQIDTLRKEYRKLLEAEHLEVLALKSHVWGMQPDPCPTLAHREQDLQALSRGAATTVRI
ncbi:BZ3500_MvSof-1268-A1-R1_Chr3-3g06442 [Microbotryum saponariae]|uniref:BZ3500_MvSof-1268-A1-R1_Chr3-3g06442 protein n=1 Tax=Microbotryum saponariae TaxID=289078 RepID=A0A2X0KZG1_9BASI|nr:BZ3500_MvSof-1268-A1-R1_Chr3-3g06442 [Microbotryum saponariae]SDA04409.1 BZ3501_MvSof-1269-A2-R1_Chr3-2g06129 [Microbotryum saponariae]